MTYKGVDTYIVGIGTVRECIDCSCLVPGGPTRCIRCAKEGPPEGNKEESSLQQSSTWEISLTMDNGWGSCVTECVDADFFEVYDDGRVVLYNKGKTQVAVYAPGQWYGVRRKEEQNE